MKYNFSNSHNMLRASNMRPYGVRSEAASVTCEFVLAKTPYREGCSTFQPQILHPGLMWVVRSELTL